jgi:hypothetical protein
MPADDHPFDALEQQFKMEDAFASPFSKAVLELASRLPLPWLLDKAVELLKQRLAADSHERIVLMLKTCMDVVRQHDEEIKRLRDKNPEVVEKRAEVLGELLLDAARKAGRTRAIERVQRIGLILGNAVVDTKPPNPDETEEMLRVAVDLSERDVVFLRELIRIEGQMLTSNDHIPRYQAYDAWERGFWGSRVDPEIDSIFSKLESYGLVARIAPPNNLNIMADFQNRYVLLKKGLRFDSLIRKT